MKSIHAPIQAEVTIKEKLWATLKPPASLKPLSKPPGPDSCHTGTLLMHSPLPSPRAGTRAPMTPRPYEARMARMARMARRHSSHECIRLNACMRSVVPCKHLSMHACMHASAAVAPMQPCCSDQTLHAHSMQESAIAGTRAMPVMQACATS